MYKFDFFKYIGRTEFMIIEPRLNEIGLKRELFLTLFYNVSSWFAQKSFPVLRTIIIFQISYGDTNGRFALRSIK